MDQAGFKRPAPDAKEHEIVGTTDVPPAPSEPVDLLSHYKALLNDAGDLATVVKLGREIQGDKRLELQSTLELHKLYTQRKSKYEK